MKQLRHGISLDGWFLGKQGVCWKCGAVVEFDASDAGKVRASSHYQNEGDLSLSWNCPDCAASNSIAGPTADQIGALVAARRAAPDV